MSTDTEHVSQATEHEANGDAQEMDVDRERVEKAVDNLRAWANQHNVPMSLITEVIDAQDGTGEEAEHLPPFHTVVSWCDIYTRSGVKLHVVAREGAGAATIVKNAMAMETALDTLMDDYDWQTADMPPMRRSETAQAPQPNRARTTDPQRELDATARGRPASRAGGDGHGEYDDEGNRIIEVTELLKAVTQNGNVKYVVRGWPWAKYGVTCWPDTGKIHLLSKIVDVDEWQVGQALDTSNYDVKAVVRLRDDGEKPDKVIDWFGQDVLKQTFVDETDQDPYPDTYDEVSF